MKLFVVLRLIVVSCACLAGCAGLAGCATLSTAGAASQCGDPCASVSCPSAFSCQVDAHCAAHCQAEPWKPGIP